MARYGPLLLLVAAACLCSVQAQKTLSEALSVHKLDLFGKLVKCAGAADAFNSAKGKVTVLAPTNAAVLAFLKSMGLSAEQLLGEEALCDALLAYHVLPYDLKASMIVKKDMTAQTLEPNSYLTVNKDAAGVTVRDMQGNVAKVSKGDLKVGDATIHLVDRVLLSGDVFYSVADALKYHSKHHTELVKALTAAGLIGAMTDPKKPFTGTILAPTEAAFKKLTITPSNDQLKNILLYHVLKDELVVPGNIKAGTKYATLFPGHSVQFKYSIAKVKDQFGQERTATVVDVIPEIGKPARMVKHNVFAGQAVIHGIDSLLIPGTTVTEKAAKTVKQTGRKLLQGRDNQVRTDFRSQAALDRTAGAIAAAATGQSSAARATAVGSASAATVSLFDGY